MKNKKIQIITLLLFFSILTISCTKHQSSSSIINKSNETIPDYSDISETNINESSVTNESKTSKIAEMNIEMETTTQLLNIKETTNADFTIKMSEYTTDASNIKTVDGDVCSAFINNTYYSLFTGSIGYTPPNYQWGWSIYKGSSIDNLKFAYDGKFDDSFKSAMKYGDERFWGYGIWIDPDTKTWYVTVHIEYNYNKMFFDWAGHIRRIGMATSKDEGRTWHYEGDIITSDNPIDSRDEFVGKYVDNGCGDQKLYVDVKSGYFYVYYFNIWLNTEDGQWKTSGRVARCAIKDKMAPGKWQKFNMNSWSQPGLGGHDSAIMPSSAYVGYNEYIQKYIAISDHGFMGICDNLEKQQWEFVKLCDYGVLYPYNWIWSPGDPKKDYERLSGQKFRLYTSYADIDGKTTKYFDITLEKGKTTPLIKANLNVPSESLPEYAIPYDKVNYDAYKQDFLPNSNNNLKSLNVGGSYIFTDGRLEITANTEPLIMVDNNSPDYTNGYAGITIYPKNNAKYGLIFRAKSINEFSAVYYQNGIIYAGSNKNYREIAKAPNLVENKVSKLEVTYQDKDLIVEIDGQRIFSGTLDNLNITNGLIGIMAQNNVSIGFDNLISSKYHPQIITTQGEFNPASQFSQSLMGPYWFYKYDLNGVLSNFEKTKLDTHRWNSENTTGKIGRGTFITGNKNLSLSFVAPFDGAIQIPSNWVSVDSPNIDIRILITKNNSKIYPITGEGIANAITPLQIETIQLDLKRGDIINFIVLKPTPENNYIVCWNPIVRFIDKSQLLNTISNSQAICDKIITGTKYGQSTVIQKTELTKDINNAIIINKTNNATKQQIDSQTSILKDQLNIFIQSIKKAPLTDINALSSKNIIEKVVDYGLISCSDTGDFSPLNYVTLSDSLNSISSLLNMSTVDTRYKSLSDGLGNKDLKHSITREELAGLLVNAYNLKFMVKTQPINATQLKDWNNVNTNSRNFISCVYSLGVMDDFITDGIGPQKYVSKEEFSVSIYRLGQLFGIFDYPYNMKLSIQ